MTTVVLEILYFKIWICPSNISTNFAICCRHFSCCNTMYVAVEWMTQLLQQKNVSDLCKYLKQSQLF